VCVYIWVSFCVLITISVRTSLAGGLVDTTFMQCTSVYITLWCLCERLIVYPALSSAGNRFLLKVTFPLLLLFFSSHSLSSLFSEALGKMKDVYEKNPQMGDPASLASQISQTSQNIERLRGEVNKYEVTMTFVVYSYYEALIC